MRHTICSLRNDNNNFTLRTAPHPTPRRKIKNRYKIIQKHEHTLFMLFLLAYKKKTKITDEYIFKRKNNSTIKGAVSRNLAKFSH